LWRDAIDWNLKTHVIITPGIAAIWGIVYVTHVWSITDILSGQEGC